MENKFVNADWVKTKKSDDGKTKEGIPLEDVIEDRFTRGSGKNSYMIPVSPRDLIEIFRVNSYPHKLTIDYKDRVDIIVLYIEWLVTSNGEFYQNLNDTSMYFYYNDGVLTHSKSYDKNSDLISYINNELKLRSTETSQLTKNIFDYAKNNSTPIRPHISYYFDMNDFKLYFYNSDEIIVLDGEEIYTQPNGKDGIIFVEDLKYEKFELLNHSGLDNYIDLNDFQVGTLSEGLDQILERIELIGNRYQDIGDDPLMGLAERCHFMDTVLDRRQQAILYYLTFYTLIFMGSFESRPFINYLGPEGSGKSTASKQLIRLFISNEEKPLMLNEDRRDFITNISDRRLVIYDNQESVPYWFSDQIAAISTGVADEQRKMRTNTDKIRVDPKCVIMITSKKPSWDAPEIADRTVPFYFYQFEMDNDHRFGEEGAHYISETEILKNISDNRSEIMTIYLHRVNQIIQNIKKKGGLRGKTSHRLTEYAILLEIVNDTLEVCSKEELQFIMDGLESHRSVFSLSQKEWFDPLIYVAMQNDGYAFNADQLFQAMKEYGYNQSKAKLFKELKTYRKPLRRLFGYRHFKKRKHLYKFDKSLRAEYQWTAGYQLQTIDPTPEKYNGKMEEFVEKIPRNTDITEPELLEKISELWPDDNANRILSHFTADGLLTRIGAVNANKERIYRRY